MNTYKPFILFFLVVLSSACYSQQIENVDFTVKDNFVTVTYDLINCPSKELYDIKLKVIKDNSTTEPNSVTGDLKKVSSGKNKRIEWNVLSDMSAIKGKIQIVVEISHTYSTKITGGPSNVFLSILMPGLGDINVDKQSGERFMPWYYISGLYLGAAYFAYSFKLESDKFYDQYHSATTQTEMDAAYISANDNYQTCQILLGVVGTIWLIDVIHVTAKGFKNRKNQLNGYSQNRPKLNLYFVGTSKSFQIGLITKF